MKKIVCLGALVFVIVLIVAASISSTPPTENEGSKEESRDYFEIYVVHYSGETIDSQLCLRGIICYLKPVLGNATNTYIPSYAGMAKDPILLGDISKGTNQSVIFQFRNPVFLHSKDNEYPFSFRIICEEAEGEVTVKLEPSS